MPISLHDLHALNDHLLEEFQDDLKTIVESGQYQLGPQVQRFEEQFARYIGAKHCIALSSGIDAIVICLNALGVGPDLEVIVPAFAPASLAMAVCRLGATPVFVDCRHDTMNMDPDMAIASMNSSRTRAIIVPHMFGLAAEIDRIMTIARTYSVAVVEVGTSATGARYHGRRLGTFGNYGTFSFGPGDALGSLGSGGAIITNDDNVVEHFRRLRDCGHYNSAQHEVVGYDSPMSALQGAFLLRKLAELDDNNLDRIANAKLYSQLLDGSAVTTPVQRDDNSHIYSQYVIQAPERQALMDSLKEKGIETGVPIATPLHLEPCFRYLEYKEGAFPVSEDLCARCLSIPVSPGLKKSQIKEIGAAITAYYGVPA